ncbi:AAR2 protein-domain-containing protein [Triangularia verruculosa]|uniref:AAR2 protein-domain-containing protein n=1 Tax=Triangularia verruculosa TaxID=2587418 RepID=A0AAN6XJ28_9PEZI|nr:AAR2 protein-domain-containing protein [Triangularia verruculosa]
MPETDTDITTGDALRILDLPDNFTIGLDMMTMTTTSSLRGFREIPPGAHFLWVQQSGAPFRSGYWFITKYRRAEFRIIKWDKFNEVLANATPGEKDAVERGHKTLTPYTLDGLSSSKTRSSGQAVLDHSLALGGSSQPLWSQGTASLWATLTDNIVPASLSRVTSQPLGHGAHVDSTTDHRRDSPPEAGTTATADCSTQFNIVSLDAWEKFTTGYNGVRPNGDEPNEVQMRELLSDLQFTFLTGTLLTNLACLQQWWKLVLNVVLKSWHLAQKRHEFVSDMLTILHAQLYFTEVCLEGDDTPGSTGGVGKGKSKTSSGPNPERVLYQVKRGNMEELRKALGICKREIETRVQRWPGTQNPFAEARRTFEELEFFLFGLGWDLKGRDLVQGRKDDEKYSSNEDEGGDEDAGWNSEEDDDEPVIVELDEEGREVGLVSFHD